MVSKNSKHDDFILAHYKKPGWTLKTIGAHLGIPPGSVRTRWQIRHGYQRKWKQGVYLSEVRPKPGMPKLKFLGEK